MRPEISVVIPAKNEGKYLERSLRQYYSIKKKLKIEIILSDGGSTDETLRIAKKYADKVILPKKNQKQNIAIGRNSGAKAAKGKFLFCTDADVIIPNITQFFKKLNEKFKDKEIVAATTELRIYPWEERLEDNIFHFIFNTSIRFASIFGSFLGKGECQFIRASTFKKVGGYKERIVVGEDNNLFYRLGKLGKVVYIKNLSVYHSPRRFRKEGYMKILYIYLREGFFLFFKGKSYSKEWTPLR